MDIIGLLGRQPIDDGDKLDRALRPHSFDDYIGQQDLIRKIKISIQAAIEREDPVDHILLNGPPGLGKTTIANVIANESKSHFRAVNAPSIKGVPDIIELLTKTPKRGVLFIDEIHALNRSMEEILYSAMEDYSIDVKLGNREIVKIGINPFCLIGATTHPGKMSPPLRDRFGINYTMQFYKDEELATIIQANAKKLGLEFNGEEAVFDLAARSRGVPRVANRLLRRIRDFAQVNTGMAVDTTVVHDAMELEGVDEHGLTKADRDYLYAVYKVYNCGPVGLTAIAATIGEDKTTIEDFVEPFLVRRGFIARTKKGRELAKKGMEYVVERDRHCKVCTS